MFPMILIAVSALLSTYTLLFGAGLESAWITTFAGLGSSIALTASFAKSEEHEADNWPQGLQAGALFLLYHLPLAYWPEFRVLPVKWVAFVTLACLAFPFLYLGKPTRLNWTISWMMGALVIALPGAVLRWGLYHSNALVKLGFGAPQVAGAIAFSVLVTVALIVGIIKGVELLGYLGFGFVTCKDPGDCRFITRGDKLDKGYVVANLERVPQAGEQPPAHLVRGRRWEAIFAWQQANGHFDARPYLNQYLLAFPGIFVVPLLAKERKLAHPFGLPHADVDHGANGHAEKKSWWQKLGDLNPVSCRLIPVPDVDIRKKGETGQASEPVAIVLGGLICVVNPRALYGSFHWEHDVDHAWDALTAAVLRHQGPNIVGFTGPLEVLLHQRPGYAASWYSPAMEPVPGTPDLEHDINHFSQHLLGPGILPEGMILKENKLSEVVESSRRTLVTAQVERQSATMRAETISQVQGVRFRGLVNALANAGLNDEQRAEILNRSAALIFAADGSGASALMTSLATVGAVAAATTPPAAAPAAGGRRRGGSGGGGTPPAGGGDGGTPPAT